MIKVTDDELVLHYYGELDNETDSRIQQAFESDPDLSLRYSRLVSVLSRINETAELQADANVESRVLDRLDLWTAAQTTSNNDGPRNGGATFVATAEELEAASLDGDGIDDAPSPRAVPSDQRTALNNGATCIASADEIEAAENNATEPTAPREIPADQQTALNNGATYIAGAEEIEAAESEARKVASDQQTALNNGATMIVGADEAAAIGSDQTAADAQVADQTGAGQRADDTGGFEYTAPQKAAQKVELPKVPGYEILGELGRGGMGVVYRAKQEGLNRVVALKMIRGGGDTAKVETLRRFQLEAEAVAQLQHPNIVQIYDIGNYNGNPFFSLEFVDGMPLDEKLDGKPLKHREAAELMVKLARAMKYAHDHKIIHRDLKPANVLLSHDGVPKVTDFGLVKNVDNDSSETRDGAVVGTPAFMAPEQAWGKSDLNHLADIYGLGAMLYAFLTGRPPFVSATPVDTVLKVRSEEAVPPRKLLPEIPADLETIVMKCLHKDPARRYVDGNDLADDLERFLDGRPIEARRVSNSERAYRWCKRNPKYAGLLATVGVLLLTVMGGGYAAAWTIGEKHDVAVAAKKEAEQQRDIAEEQQAIAVAKRKEADEQRRIAEEHARVASGQTELALDAMRETVYEVNKQLKTKPNLQTLRNSILNGALTRMSNTLDETSEVAEYDASKVLLASSHRKIGNLSAEMGFYGKAQKHLEIALKMCEEMHTRKVMPDPDMNLGHVYGDLGRVAKSTGRVADASGYLTKSLSHLENWLAGSPDDQGKQLEVAQTHYQLGSVATRSGDLETAEDHYTQSMKVNEEILKKNPNDFGARSRLAGSYSTLSDMHFGKGELDKAVEFARRSLDAFSDLNDLRPSQAGRRNVARKRMALGKKFLNAGDAASASEFLRKVRDEFVQLHSEDKENAEIHQNLAMANYVLGVALRKLDEDENAKEAFATSAEIRHELLEKSKNSLELQGQLMLALARLGKLDEAEKLADVICSDPSGQPYLMIYAACGYGIAAANCQGESRQTELFSKALKQVEIGIDKGFHDFETLRRDFDLNPLQNRDDFVELLKSREAGLKAGKEAKAKNGKA